MGVLVSGTFHIDPPGDEQYTRTGMVCFSSVDGGVSFSQVRQSSNRSLVNVSLASVNPIFNSVGQTRVDTPGGEPGQIAAVGTGSQIFAVVTSSIGGEVVPLIAATPDDCQTWNTTLAPVPNGGSAMDPQIVLSGNGYAYVSWREDGQGEWSVDQGVYGLNGHAWAVPAALPGSQQPPAEGPIAMLVDPFKRPVLVWSVNPSGTLGVGSYSGAFLPPLALSELFRVQVAQLERLDFKDSNTEHDSALNRLAIGLVSYVNDSNYLAAVQGLLELYPRVTNASFLPQSSTYCLLNTSQCVSTALPQLYEWIQNLTGPLAPNQFLPDYVDLTLESLGLGILSPPPGDATISGTASVSGTLLYINPITSEVSLSWYFPPTILQRPGFKINLGPPAYIHECPANSPGFNYVVVLDGNLTEDSATSFSVSVTAGLGSSPPSTTFDTTASTANAYLTDLGLHVFTPWTATVVGAYTQTTTYYDCYHVQGVLTASSPTGQTLTSPTLSSVVKVEYGTYGGPITGGSPEIVQLHTILDSNGNPVPGVQGVSLQWNNTEPAYVSVGPSLTDNLGTTYTPYTNLQGFSPLTPAPPEPLDSPGSYWFQPVTGVGSYDRVSFTGSTQVGTDFPTDAPGTIPQGTPRDQIVHAGGPTSSPAATQPFACTFLVSAGPSLSQPMVSELEGGVYEVSWTANVDSAGTAEVRDLASPGFVTFGAIPGQVAGVNQWAFSVVLRGITDFDVVQVIVSNSLSNGYACYSNTAYASVTFATPGQVSLSEQDLPYDSVSQQGGGAWITWGLPSWFLAAPGLTYSGGEMVYVPESAPSGFVHVPLTSLAELSTQSGNFLENLTTLTPGLTYDLSMTLNFTLQNYQGTFAVTAYPFSFTYLKDTSGDGLSDAEKKTGWTVAYTAIDGSSVNDHVTADINSYATNGLVNDLLEKEYGLNPNRIDTSGSHMLDTWDLTFSNPSGQCPAGFECWNEEGTNFDPFSLPQFKGVGVVAPGDPNGPTPTNFTEVGASATYPFTGPDSSPWGSGQLWSFSDLNELQMLEGTRHTEWLRAILSYTQNLGWTVTVEGKLTWGANPLAASTYGDGVADGSRVDPLGPMYFQVHEYWNVYGLKDGQGTAMYLQAQQPSFYTQCFCVNVYTGFSPTEFSSSGVASGGFGGPQITYTFAVDDTWQWVTFNASIVANEGTSGQNCAQTCTQRVTGPVQSVDLASSFLSGNPVQKYFATGSGYPFPDG
ncbi:MAG: hypothetical protein KGI89_16030, partial [Euryarchaeota archaeon]|nr:hypothetical protein [Euryarchaeota archaeon]